MSSIIVRKFGGAGLSTVEKVKQAALSLKLAHDRGNQVIAVVSAMGKTTDQLIAKAHEISPRPDRRELDMLISTGERVSMALLTMALKDIGCSAISFTGSQAGVMTDDSHGIARIIEIKPIRVQESLAKNQIVVIAGFQGVDPKTKEITTLGRGGTDTTAVAFAAHFNAHRCEIIKEVDGIFTADPNRIENAQLISQVGYNSLLHMCQWGAKALHFRSVEMAQKLNTKIWVGSMQAMGSGTLCSQAGSSNGMNVLEDLFYISTSDANATELFLKERFDENGWRSPLVIFRNEFLWLQGSQDMYKCVCETLENTKETVSDFGYQCVTLTGFSEPKTNLSEDCYLKTPLGIHYFFKKPRTNQELNSIYNQFFHKL